MKEKKLNGRIQFRNLVGLLLAFSMPALATECRADDKAELKLFEGSWTVVKLIEDGQVIPLERIPEVLPSGGRLEIVDNSMLFVDPHSGKRHARTITIDPTRYPSTIDIKSADEPEVSRGIYKFDNGQLVVCFGDPFTEVRPAELSAPKGSGAVTLPAHAAAIRKLTRGDPARRRGRPTKQPTFEQVTHGGLGLFSFSAVPIVQAGALDVYERLLQGAP